MPDIQLQGICLPRAFLYLHPCGFGILWEHSRHQEEEPGGFWQLPFARMPGSAVPSTTPLHPSMKRIPLTSGAESLEGKHTLLFYFWAPQPYPIPPKHVSEHRNSFKQQGSQHSKWRERDNKKVCREITKTVGKDEEIKELHYDSCLSHGERMLLFPISTLENIYLCPSKTI